jgi:Sulfotransferase domain
MKLPNFFLVGTAKAGTTSVHYYLSQHPDVLMSNPKEPTFFQTEYERGLDYYFSTYFKNYTGQSIVGDAAPQHLYLPYVARRIHATVPTARLAVICRDPVDRAISAYWQSASRGVETRSFDEVIELNIERMRHGPCFETEEEGAHYAEIARKGRVHLQRAFGFYIEPGYYARYIELYQSLFGRDKLRILFFEDLQRDPSGTINQLLDFLGLGPIALQDVNAQNEAVSKSAARIIEFVGGIPAVGRISPHLRTRIKRQIGRVLSGRKKVKLEVSLAARRRLLEHYRPHNRRLAEITGRDLSHWDSVADAAAVS